MLNDHSFSDCYQQNHSYYQSLSDDAQSAYLASHFVNFLGSDGAINFKYLKDRLVENSNFEGKIIPNVFRNAVNLFKTLYSPIYKCLNSSQTQGTSFKHIKNIYGFNIIAHGVEEAKGGISNILLMWITNTIHVPRQYWGQLVDGLPNISSVNHGPYYLIASIDGGKPPHFPKTEDILFVLVPFQEIESIIESQIRLLVKDGMLTDSSAHHLISKLITYDEFLITLTLNNNFYIPHGFNRKPEEYSDDENQENDETQKRADPSQTSSSASSTICPRRLQF